MPARPSDVRAWLKRFAEKKGMEVEEFVSDLPGQRIAYYCTIECPVEKPCPHVRVVEAMSHDGPDNALVKCFLAWANPELDFLDFA